MIKTIKKIDLQGNEVWQEVCVCNRCKKVLEPTDFVYEIKWTGWHTVKLEPGIAYGFGSGSNPIRHICTSCQKKVEAFLEGKEIFGGRQTNMTCDNCKFDCKSADNETCERFKNVEFYDDRKETTND